MEEIAFNNEQNEGRRNNDGRSSRGGGGGRRGGRGRGRGRGRGSRGEGGRRDHHGRGRGGRGGGGRGVVEFSARGGGRGNFERRVPTSDTNDSPPEREVDKDDVDDGDPPTPTVELDHTNATPNGSSSFETMQEVSVIPRQHPNHAHCLVCYAEDLPRHRGVTPCGHDHVCGQCHLRLRFLHTDRKCPVCKTENDRIIIDFDRLTDENEIIDDNEVGVGGEEGGKNSWKRFEEYEMWGDNEIGPGYTFREDVGMFFLVDYYHSDVLPIFSLRCMQPGCSFANAADSFVESSVYDPNRPNAKQKKEVKRLSGMKALNEHLRTVHTLTLCQLCVTAKRDFVSKLPRFTPSQLKTHQSKGEGKGSGFTGHPLCEFCRPKRFYDLTKLHEHLNKEHFKCHICEKQGRPNQFFKNYDKLALHFDREHYFCHDPQCIAARFVVFENDIDLRGHEISVHGGSSSSSKIKLEFQYRRANEEILEGQEVPSEEDFQFGLNGEAFVPESLPPQQENEPLISYPEHAARTAELRAEAARTREELRRLDVAEDEAFPTLQTGDTSSSFASATTAAHSGVASGSIVGWTAEGRANMRKKGVVNRKEDFPSLPASRNTTSATARRPRSDGPPSNQFAAMRAAAMQTPTVTPSPSSAPSPLWISSSPASATPGAAPLSSSQPITTSSAPVASRNRQQNLAPDNFPSLGGGGGRNNAPTQVRYAAAEALAKKNAAMRKQKKAAGANLTPEDFPPPMTTTNPKPAVTRLDRKPSPSPGQLSNVLEFPPPPPSATSMAHGMATVESMKLSLGPNKYKKLKSLTKEFALDQIDPETYITRSSNLFEDGVKDKDFWSFLPGLIQSCPNESASAAAMRYMEQSRLAYQPATNNNNNISNGATTTSTTTTSTTTTTDWASAAASIASAPPRTSSISTNSKKKKGKGTWGNGISGAGSKARVMAPKSNLAAQAGPTQQVGTATKYMAQVRSEERRHKQEESQKKQGSGKGKQKKKKNDELKALAFGGK